MTAHAKFEIKSGSGFAVIEPGSGRANGRTVEGLLTVWDLIDLGGDMTVRGAFSRTLSENPRPPLLWAHDEKSVPIGRVTLAAETSEGVYFTAALNETTKANDVLLAVRNGDVSGVSYGYSARRVDYVQKGDKTVRRLLDVELFETSLVNFPMLPSARLIGAGKAWLNDALAIGRYEALTAKGIPPSRVMTLKAIKAYQRQNERLMFNGRTQQEVMYELAYEIQELERERRKA